MVAGRWMLGVAAAALMAGQAKADLVISNKATVNVNCAGGVCTATAPNAVLNAGDLANLLAAADVKVATGAGALNILVKAPLSWTSASRLTLDANMSITIIRPVTVAGTGAMTMATNDGGSGGDLMFNDKGAVTFWDSASSLVINGNSYTLVKDIATLASDIAANPSGFYALANDYDASKDGTYTSSPVRTEVTGTVEGLGHAISNLKINSPDFEVGLFAQASGTLRDIGVIAASIQSTGSNSDVGTLLARSELATIVACRATGSVHAANAFGVGGLVGVTGMASDGTLRRSYAGVSVLAGDGGGVGGLVGQSGFVISLSYATGQVKAGNNASVGGLVGVQHFGAISQSFATGTIHGGNNSSMGGILGSGGNGIDNSYAMGAVGLSHSGITGGFAGDTTNMGFTSSYSTGHVKGRGAGGFLGEGLDDLFTSNYWDVDTSGKTKRQGEGSCNTRCRRGIKGLTTSEFQSGLPAGFDPNIWAEKDGINNGYPYLRALPPQ